jgi:NAD(P)-dependent dehydrogenase (short-subunit alcohol dehydrogenase family)
MWEVFFAMTMHSGVVDAVVFLAEARSVTGQMIAVDGGQHLAWETPDVLPD